MSIHVFQDQMKKIQSNLLSILDNISDTEENHQNLLTIFDDIKIHDDIYKLESFLNLVVKISNNHHRETNFFNKIDKILLLFKEDLQKKYTNHQLFNIFKSNKRLLLFLIEEQIITIDEYFVKKITSLKYSKSKYPQYFLPEIKSFMDKKWFPSHLLSTLNEIPENFYENRKIGENDSLICQLIQKDLIKDFIVYINKNNISLKSKIKPLIYETNSYLMKEHKIIEDYQLDKENKNEFSLIEYATFYGSIQIFKYLNKNGVELLSSLWTFAIYGKNPEIIHLLEDNHIELPDDYDYNKLFFESIKCHHNDIANYILNNYLDNKIKDDDEAYIKYLKYYNFEWMQNDLINDEKSFFYLCKYDYVYLVKILLNEKNIDINKLISGATEGADENINDGHKVDIREYHCIYDDIIEFDGNKKKYNKTAFYIAVEKENIEIVKLFLTNKNLDINLLNFEEYKISWLFQGWANYTMDDTHNWKSFNKNALHVAIENENIEILDLLLKNENLDINLETFESSKNNLILSGDRVEGGDCECYENDYDYVNNNNFT